MVGCRILWQEASKCLSNMIKALAAHHLLRIRQTEFRGQIDEREQRGNSI